MMRHLALLVTGLLVVAGCGSDRTAAPDQTTAPSAAQAAETPSAAPTPDAAAELAEAQQLTRSLYYDHSSVYSTSDYGAVAQFMVDHNHPEYVFTVDECRTEIDKAISGAVDYVQTLIPDVASMALDPGWTISRGRYAGLQPSGTTYILTVTNQVSVASAGYNDDAQAQVHVTILDGRAYYYQICEPD